jgi:transposase-like protein
MSLLHFTQVSSTRSLESAATILSGIELVQMMRKRQARFAFNPNPSLAEQFAILTGLPQTL